MRGNDKLNKVDRQVRRSLMQYPTLFRSRFDVLRHIIMGNGTGYEWTADGCLESIYNSDRPANKMQYDDLDEKVELNTLTKKDEPDYIRSLYRARRVFAEEERIVREYRARYINVYAKENGTLLTATYEQLEHFSPDYSRFADAPCGNIDKDWLDALEEVHEIIMRGFNRIWSLHYDYGDRKVEPSMYSRMPEVWRMKYDRLQAIADKLEAQSGRRARRAEAAETVLNMLKKDKEDV